MVIHRSGKLNTNADALSRRADYQEGETVKVRRTLFKKQDGKLVHQVAALEIGLTPELQRAKEAQDSAYSSEAELYEIYKTYNLKSNRKLLLRDGLVWIPPKLEKDWILRHHELLLQGHARPEVILERLRRNY